MIIGIGTDIVHIARIKALIEKQEERFLQRVFSEDERHAGQKYKDQPEAYNRFFAKRFAAKEATAKALGTGFRDGVYLKDIAVHNDDLGKPYLAFSGGAFDLIAQLTPPDGAFKAHLSLSDDPPFALAYVILENV
jgi:holo-[acyl-carrier protein] synthase